MNHGGTGRSTDFFNSLLADAGVEIIEPASDPALDLLEREFAEADRCIAEIAAFEMRWPFFEYAAAGHGFHPRIGRLLDRARTITLADYHAALDFKASFRDHFRIASERVDAIIGLTAPEVAPLGLENIGHPVTCSPATCAGAPSLTLPVMAVHGLPLGLQLVGFHAADAALFAHASWVGTALGE